MNETVEENARMTNWKTIVEQALTEAEARDQARQQDAATAEDGVDATKASNIAAQEGQTTRIDPGAAREPAKKQAETLNASNEDGAAAETKAASASSVAKVAIAAIDAKRADTKREPARSERDALAIDTGNVLALGGRAMGKSGLRR
jgi:L-lysine 2,3-aminomutase